MKLELLWEEDFSSGPALDESNWNFDLGDGTKEGIPGWGNNERQYYGRDCIDTSSGLTITSTRLNVASAPDCYYGPAEWASSRIHTSNKVSFQFGRIEAVLKPPAGKGSWPALWMLGDSIANVGWPKCGEIDIFEYAGNRPLEVCGTVHGPGYSGEFGIGSKQVLADPLSSKFHTVSIDWLPDSITWQINGASYFKITRSELASTREAWPFNEPHFLLINLAMGGWFGGEIAPETNDCSYQIKSIKHYSIDGVGFNSRAN